MITMVMLVMMVVMLVLRVILSVCVCVCVCARARACKVRHKEEDSGAHCSKCPRACACKGATIQRFTHAVMNHVRTVVMMHAWTCPPIPRLWFGPACWFAVFRSTLHSLGGDLRLMPGSNIQFYRYRFRLGIRVYTLGPTFRPPC